MIKIQPVKEYNREAREKWQKRITETNYPKEIMPSLAMYLFLNEKTGEPKKTGYVLSHGKTHYWFKTKKEALNKLKELV